MTNKVSSASLNFTQACSYLEILPDDFTQLRRKGFIACINDAGRQSYPQPSLTLTRKLLSLGESYGWSHDTLAWYADLVFATEVGRAILLPLVGNTVSSRNSFTNWLETPYVSAVNQDLDVMLEETSGPL